MEGLVAVDVLRDKDFGSGSTQALNPKRGDAVRKVLSFHRVEGNIHVSTE